MGTYGGQIEVLWPMITSTQTTAHCDRNIGVVATARKLVTNVYYGARTVTSAHWPKEPRMGLGTAAT
jgi:hypothetical protein